MILPNVRAAFGRSEAQWLVRLLAGGEAERERHWEAILAQRGIDPLLDDPAALEALVSWPGVTPIPPGLAVYVFLRRTLLDAGVEDRMMADYMAALVLHFGYKRRSFRIAEYDDKEYFYLVDIVKDLDEATGQRAFLLSAHLGNFALWLSGLFPDYITARVHRKAGPDIEYYETMGQTGFRLAASDTRARQGELDALYREVAAAFREVRRALNRFSDQYLLPRPASPVDRLLRQVRTDFDN